MPDKNKQERGNASNSTDLLASLEELAKTWEMKAEKYSSRLKKSQDPAEAARSIGQNTTLKILAMQLRKTIKRNS